MDNKVLKSLDIKLRKIKKYNVHNNHGETCWRVIFVRVNLNLAPRNGRIFNDFKYAVIRNVLSYYYAPNVYGLPHDADEIIIRLARPVSWGWTNLQDKRTLFFLRVYV